MKKFIYFFIVIFFVAGCKKDNNGDDMTGYISLNGQKYAVEKGYYFDGDGIYVISSGITLDLGAPDLPLSGTGNLIVFFDYEQNQDGTPKVGVYQINNFDGGLGINYSIVAETYDYLAEFAELTSGTCTISKEGDKYEIEISFTDDNENVVIAYFLGVLTNISI